MDWDYAWFCRPAQKAIEASDGCLDDEEVSTSKEVEEIKAEMNELQRVMVLHDESWRPASSFGALSFFASPSICVYSIWLV